MDEIYQGKNNALAVLSEAEVCLRFSFIDQDNQIEYQETAKVTTDLMGTVNLLIGNGEQTDGYANGFSAVLWDGNAKNLEVEVDIEGYCSRFEFVSSEPFTYVPFAFIRPSVIPDRKALRVFRDLKVPRVCKA